MNACYVRWDNIIIKLYSDERGTYMARTRVNWNEVLYRNFCELAMLDEREREILRMRIMGYTVSEMSETTGWSARTVHRIINTLYQKYNELYPKYSDILPEPKTSKEEEYMDTH